MTFWLLNGNIFDVNSGEFQQGINLKISDGCIEKVGGQPDNNEETIDCAGKYLTPGDSYLLSGATNITYDLYAKVINPNATDEQKFKITRYAIAIAGVFAYILIQFFPSVLAIQFWSYTIYGAGITPALLGALCWKKVTKSGGISSMVIGALVTVIWEMFKHPFGVATVLVAVPVSFVVLIIVSLMTQSQNKQVMK